MSGCILAKAYDFIVVGGGSAGCLLARLLAEADLGSVALIEAGRATRDARTVAPAYYPRTFGSGLDWRLVTEPQGGLNGRRIAWPRGKTLGGSGAINALIYLQAAAGDFNRWSAAGCEGWDWPSISKMLGFSEVDATQCPFSGLALAKLAAPQAWSSAFLEACTAHGFQLQRSWLQAADRTCGYYSLTQSHGRRQHTGQPLFDSRTYPNLDLISGHTVESLEIVADRVTAVRLRCEVGETSVMRAAGEVILAAGAIGSPEVLLRSGIGAPRSLGKLGIKTKLHSLGVGENLQDHLVYPLVYRVQATDGLPSRFSHSVRQLFREHGTGPLGSNIAEAGATFAFDSRETHESTACPDVQIHFTPTHYLKYPSRTAPRDHFSLAMTDLHPRSRGRLHLQNDQSSTVALLDPCYLKHPEDIRRMLQAVSLGREIANQSSLKSLIVEEIMPGAKRVDAAAIERSLRTFAGSIYHPVGTCKMGVDPMAVVDPNLRVHGMSNLHVADASVLPDLPSANTQAVTLLVAARKFQLLRDK